MDESDDDKIATIHDAIGVLRTAIRGMTEAEASMVTKVVVRKLHSSKRYWDRVEELPDWMKWAADEAAMQIASSPESKEDLAMVGSPTLWAWELLTATVALATIGRLKDPRAYLGLLFGAVAVSNQHLGHRQAPSVMARKRHAENYALVEEALKHWREKIDPKLSASKAADELVRVVPLGHKKLSEIVSAEKKKQPQ